MKESYLELDYPMPSEPGVPLSELRSASPRSSLTFRLCWGFSTGSRQAAALVPFSCRSTLGQDPAQDYFFVHCLGSWCVVRSAGPYTTITGGAADSLCTNDGTQSFAGRDPRQRRLATWSGTARRDLAAMNPLTLDRLSHAYTERVFSRHGNKVNLVVYSPALKLCLSGTALLQSFALLRRTRVHAGVADSKASVGS